MIVSGVIHLTSKTLYGMSSRNTPQYLFQPFDPSVEPFLVGSCERDRSRNLLATAMVADTLSRIHKGVIVRILGPCGDPTAEQEALLWRYCSDVTIWSPRRLQPIVRPSFKNRLDLTAVPTINIDPPGCVDIDDCISIWEEDGTTKVAITIADVHEWVCQNMWVLPGATAIGQTLYRDGVPVVSMLPAVLSTDLCSLRPGVDRLGVALLFDWDGTQICNPTFKPVLLHNKTSYTYDTVQGATDFPVQTLRDIASRLAGSSTEDPHVWVETLMVYYNRIAARELLASKNGVFRCQPPPVVERLAALARWPVDMQHLAQSRAVYSATVGGHWGLKADAYCHVTSPIRRMADLINQSALKGKPLPFSDEHLTLRNQAAKRYERDSFFLTTLLLSPKDAPLTGVVVDSNDARSRIWVSSWKRLVTAYDQPFHPGTVVSINYFLDLSAVSWKRRMILKCEDTGCRVQQSPEPESVAQIADAPVGQDPSSQSP
jgi:exoribonuclease R